MHVYKTRVATPSFLMTKVSAHNTYNPYNSYNRRYNQSTMLTPAEETRVAIWILSKAKLEFPLHSAVQIVLKDAPRPNKLIDDRPGDKAGEAISPKTYRYI